MLGEVVRVEAGLIGVRQHLEALLVQFRAV
jgi:hypothetical protein